MGFAPKKETVIIVVSLIALVSLVTLLYPLAKEASLVGFGGSTGDVGELVEQNQAVPGFTVDTTSFVSECEDKPAGYTYHFGEGGIYANICAGDALVGTCNSKNDGLVKTLGTIDVLCDYSTATEQSRWVECETNGKQLTSGEGSGKALGIMSPEYVCVPDGPHERIYRCPLGTNPEGSTALDSVEKVERTTSAGYTVSYVCDESWKKCSNQGEVAIEGKYVCDKPEWKECTTENEVTQWWTHWCDGTAWQKCEATGPSDNGAYWCSGEQGIWLECTAEKKNSYSYDTKYICNGETWTAVASANQAPAGFSWPSQPIADDDVPTEECVATTFDGINVCCSAATDCPERNYQAPQSLGDYYCYSQGTVYQNSQLCSASAPAESAWLECDTALAAAPEAVEENRFLCVRTGKETYVWQRCDTAGLAPNNQQFFCDGTQWIQCNQQTEGDVTANDGYNCRQGEWRNDFSLGPLDYSEVTLQQGSQEDTQKDISIVPFVAAPKVLQKLWVCDTQTKNVGFKTTLCYQEAGTAKQQVVGSLQTLQGSAEKFAVGQIEGKPGYLYYYQESTPKTVSVFYVVSLSGVESAELSLTGLATNFLQGRRVMLELDGHYYLLDHPEKALDPNEMVLYALPSQKIVPVEELATNQKYQFRVQAKKTIVVTFVDGKVVFTEGKPTTALAGAVETHNLAAEYEVAFSHTQPVELEDLGGSLTVCLSDAGASDPSQLHVCLAEQDATPFVTLKRDVLTKAVLAGKEVVLLYQFDPVTNTKQGFVFRLEKPTAAGLGNELGGLAYTDFIENMVDASQRLAFEFVGNLYLLRHEAELLDLSSFVLTSYTEEGATEFPAGTAGGAQVEVPVDGGKVFITQQFGSPPPPFQVTAFTTQQIVSESLDLAQQFSTSMSSLVPVKVSGPVNYGILSVDETLDVHEFAGEFHVASENQPTIVLGLNEPQESSQHNVLFDYYSASVKGQAVVKSVRLYYLYDLNDGKQTRAFDNSLITVFKDEGRVLALKFGESYYLLSYETEVTDTATIFRFSNLTLEALDGSETYPGSATNVDVTFMVPEGAVTIAKEGNQLVFAGKREAVLEAEAATVDFELEEEFKHVLQPNQIVNVILPTAEHTYQICDKGLYQTLIKDRVQLCKDGVEMPFLTLEKDEVNTDEGFLIYFRRVYNEESGTLEKRVFMNKILPLTKKGVSFPSWLHLTEQFSLGNFPALQWNDEWYELQGYNQYLHSLYLDPLFTNGYCDIYVYPGPLGEQNGTFACFGGHWENGEWVKAESPDLLFASQTLDPAAGDSSLSMKPITEYQLVTGTALNQTAVGQTLLFTPTLKKQGVFGMTLQTMASLVWVEFSENGAAFFRGYFPQGVSRQVLLPNNETVTFYVADNELPQVSLTK